MENHENGNHYLLPGTHYVNRIGYIASEKPWTDQNIEVLYFDYSQMERLTMCKTANEGGQRCASHTRKAVTKATERRKVAERRSERTGRGNQDPR